MVIPLEHIIAPSTVSVSMLLVVPIDTFVRLYTLLAVITHDDLMLFIEKAKLLLVALI